MSGRPPSPAGGGAAGETGGDTVITNLAKRATEKTEHRRRYRCFNTALLNHRMTGRERCGTQWPGQPVAALPLDGAAIVGPYLPPGQTFGR